MSASTPLKNLCHFFLVNNYDHQSVLNESQLPDDILFEFRQISIDFQKSMESQSKFIETIEKNSDLALYLLQKHRVFLPQNFDLTINRFLITAAQSGNIQLVIFLLENSHINLHEVHNLRLGKQILCAAASSGNKQLVKYLIETVHIDPRNTQEFGCSNLLFYASISGSKELVAYLIEEQHLNPRASMDPCDITILGHAAKSGNIELVEYLIKTHQFNPQDIADPLYNTVLHYAALSKNSDLVIHLINTYRLDPLKLNSFGESVLHTIAQTGNSILLEYVLQNYNVDSYAVEKLRHLCSTQLQTH